MTENRNSPQGSNGVCNNDTVCIDTMQVLDSCRDRDCFENVRVYLTAQGQEYINNAVTVRAKSAEIVWVYINVNPVAFNDGFYQINIRFFVRVNLDACLSPGRPQEFSGIAALDKSVVLYGGKGNINIYKSQPDGNICPDLDNTSVISKLPTGVVEAVEPIILSSKVVPTPIIVPCICCPITDIPDNVIRCAGGNLMEQQNGNILLVTLGIFSVVRIERPSQLLITASDYTVPDKECRSTTDDPCCLFKSMSFPTEEFSSGACRSVNSGRGNSGGCGCGNQSNSGGCGCGSRR